MPRGVVDPGEVAHWDEEVDVLVVGLGAAGAAAALDAASAGAETLVLERASGGGGTSAMSGGVLYLGGGTALQRACGFEDSAEAMFEYLKVSCGDAPDEANEANEAKEKQQEKTMLKPALKISYDGNLRIGV